MTEEKYLYHYTTIEKLALILNKQTIRFNRLDQVDDLRESTSFGKINLSKYLFVSCWTDVIEENLALWSMYSNGMTGVRISLPIDPFNYQPLQKHPFLNIKMEEPIVSFLPIEEIFTNEYVVNAIGILKKDLFIKKVLYIDEKQLIEIRNRSINALIDEKGIEWTSIAS
ncbi:MAG: hypothetical protein C0412_12655 [Flavobacterium sp.]|nr:hypothetical protein [Flavobacterium sp.]